MSARRLLPAAVILLALALALLFDLQRFLGLESLRAHREFLTGLVAARPVLAGLAFMAVYAGVVAVSLPGATVLTLAGGFLFGVVWGGLLSAAGAAAGAVCVFLAARFAFADLLRARAGPWLARLEQGFRANAFSYLLFLRLVPAFPFFIVNLAPAFLGVSLATFAAATAIGILPGSFVFASVGAGLGAVLDSDGPLTPGTLLTPPVLAGLIGLAVLALLPVLVRRIRRR